MCLNRAFQVEGSERKKREEKEQRRAEEERKKRDEIRRQQMELQWQKEEEVRLQPPSTLIFKSLYLTDSRSVESWRRSRRDNKFCLKWKREERLKRKLEGEPMSSRSARHKETYFVCNMQGYQVVMKFPSKC